MPPVDQPPPPQFPPLGAILLFVAALAVLFVAVASVMRPSARGCTALANLRHFILEFLMRPWTWLVAALIVGIGVQVWRETWRWRDSAESARGSRESSVLVEESGNADWPMERGAPERLGRVGAATGPGDTSVRRRWRFGRAGESVHGSVAIVGTRVHAIGSEGYSARVVALDLETGELAWSSGPRDYRATFAGPVVVGNWLVGAEGLHTTRDARVFALDLRPRREGALLWTFTTASHVECTPQVDRDRIWFNAGDDGVHGLQWSGKPGESPRRLFHRSGDSFPDAETCLLVAGERAYVGLGVGGNALVVLDSLHGEERHRLATPHPVFAPPALHGDRLFVGMGAGDYTNPQAARAGAVWCVSAESLDVLWRHELPGTVLGAVSVDASWVVAPCGDGRVRAWDHDGRELGTWDTGAPIAASLAVTERYLYGVNQSGTLFAIDRQLRQLAWRHRVGEPGHYMSGPIAVRDRLVFGTPHDGVVCYEPAEQTGSRQ